MISSATVGKSNGIASAGGLKQAPNAISAPRRANHHHPNCGVNHVLLAADVFMIILILFLIVRARSSFLAEVLKLAGPINCLAVQLGNKHQPRSHIGS